LGLCCVEAWGAGAACSRTLTVFANSVLASVFLLQPTTKSAESKSETVPLNSF